MSVQEPASQRQEFFEHQLGVAGVPRSDIWNDMKHGVFLEGAMFFRQKKSGDRTYLQIVENRWQGGGSKQRVICTLGRLDELEASGQLQRLISSGANYSESMMVIDVHSRGDAPVMAVRRIGPGL